MAVIIGGKMKEFRMRKQNKTLVLKEFGVEIEKETHHKGKTYAECEKDCPEGWEIVTYELLQKLRNSKYIKELNLEDTWEFVQQPDNFMKTKGYFAIFWALSDGVSLSCGRVAQYSDAGLGVRFKRKLQ